jgi:glycine betaine/proline transport system ATP-binding protein
MTEPAPTAVKIACRNLWKVYGADPDQFFDGRRGRVERADDLRRRIVGSGHIAAACDVSFEVGVGEIFVIMGLSGSGKSTTVRCLSRLVEPTAGEVLLDGRDLLKISERELIEFSTTSRFPSRCRASSAGGARSGRAR